MRARTAASDSGFLKTCTSAAWATRISARASHLHKTALRLLNRVERDTFKVEDGKTRENSQLAAKAGRLWAAPNYRPNRLRWRPGNRH
jgi:hypothetical protein